MSTQAANYYHQGNGSVQETWQGFSWPCLFLGCIWYIYTGLWGWGVIAFILAIATSGISWLIFPFFANKQHELLLQKQGYLDQKQWKEKEKSRTAIPQSQPSSVSDELTKLVALKEQGILTDEEFSTQKGKILS